MSDFPNKSKLRTSGALFSFVFFLLFYLLPFLLKSENNSLFLILPIIIFFISILTPYTLRIPYQIWIKIGDYLSKLNSNLILVIFFYFAITPVSIIMRLTSFLMKLVKSILKRSSNQSSSKIFENKTDFNFEDLF